MSKYRILPVLAATLLLAAAPLVAGEKDRRPRLHRAAVDGAPVLLEIPQDGRAVAAWTWWESGETDLAVAVRASNGAWGEPFRFGMRDGTDQVDPALALDPAGHVYLVFATRGSGTLSLAMLFAGADAFTPALELLGEGSGASAPALRVVGDRLVVAWREGWVVRMTDLPLAGTGAYGWLGVQDGPDGFNPLGQAPSDPGPPVPEEPGSPPPKPPGR